MSPINKYEALGIFGSIAVMAVALALLTYKTDELIATDTSDTQAGAAITAREDESLGSTLQDAQSANGEIQDIVIDDVKIGTGKLVELGDAVTVHYVGSMPDGVQFDNSYQRGTPFTFTLGEQKVIEGWERGVIGMQVGGERVLVIPPKYAYGNRQVGPIAANSTLVFVIELLEIN